MSKIPETKVKNVTETIHGRKIIDPYRWLEDGESAEVKKWVNAQNKHTQEELAEYSHRTLIKKQLLRYLETDWIGIPTVCDDFYFWRERRGTQNQAILYYKKGLHAKKKLLLNPNALNKQGTTTVNFWSPSPRGTYVVYGLSENGTEEAVLHILEIKTGKLLAEKISRVRYDGAAWLPDESGFFYIRYPKTGSVPKGEEWYHPRIYLHNLGTSADTDDLVFGEGLPKDDMLDFSLSRDGLQLVISAQQGWSKNDVYIYETVTKKLSTVVSRKNSKFTGFIHRGRIYLLTDYKAPRFRVIAADVASLPKNIDRWETIIPETKRTIEHISLVSDVLAVSFLENASSRLVLFDLKGNQKKQLTLPTLGAVGALTCDSEGKEFFYNFESFVSPASIYRYDMAKKRDALYVSVKSPSQAFDYETKQIWYTSKDKVKVPMFVFHKKGLKLNGDTPTLLYGYGGFASNVTPFYFKGYMPFLNNGGVIAAANIRGGAEFGEQWHQDGILAKKQNSFNDFIAAAEALIKKRYTNPRRLAIMGGSNGGLLVGACMVQRPDLYQAVICRVPLLDMVRFPKFLIASRWTAEYGDPSKKKDFEQIMRWSPYHNVKKGVEYPPILFTTANKDRRVDPLHARKMCALLQAHNQKNAVLIRVETNAGHGAGKPLSKIADEQTDVLAFLHWQLGMND